jgi:hypothetical protein
MTIRMRRPILPLRRLLPVALLVPLVALAACGERQKPTTTPREPDRLGDPATDRPPAVPLPASTRWRFVASGEGSFLQRTDATGNIVLTIGCATAPPGVEVGLPRVPRVASEDRVSVGLGADILTLVADLGRARPGVTARGALDDAFLTQLEGATGISALYGTSRIGPFGPPPADQREALLAACRDLADAAPAG